VFCLEYYSTPFKKYAQPISKKAIKSQQPVVETEEKKLSNHAQRKLDERKKGTLAFTLNYYIYAETSSHIEAKIDPLLESQFGAGRLYASISSRPGQSGRADGYILEGKELEVCGFSLRSCNLTHNIHVVLPQKNQDRKTKALDIMPNGARLQWMWFIQANDGLPVAPYYCMMVMLSYVHCNLSFLFVPLVKRVRS